MGPGSAGRPCLARAARAGALTARAGLWLGDMIRIGVRLSPLCGTSGTVTDPNVYDIGTYQLIGSISLFSPILNIVKLCPINLVSIYPPKVS